MARIIEYFIAYYILMHSVLTCILFIMKLLNIYYTAALQVHYFMNSNGNKISEFCKC